MEWFELKDISNIDSPALLVYPSRMKSNIAAAISMVGDPARLRPHIKTHKSLEVAQMMLDAGITKFKCATIAEAELLGMLYAPDVLLAYQPVGPKVDRLFSLIERYPLTQYSCLVDHPDAVLAISNIASKTNSTVNVYLDIDVGMHRTGILPESAYSLFELCNQNPGISVKGLHAYDGHIRDSDLELRKQHADEAILPVYKLLEHMQGHSHLTYDLICGGSPTFPIHAGRSFVVCSPGTFIYWDQGYGELYEGKTFQPAAVLITRVISVGANHICTDLGHKSVASENDINHRIYFLNAKDLKPIGQSEEHLVLHHAAPNEFHIGDVLYGITHHICPTVALYERVYSVEDNGLAGEWFNIARDRKINI